MNEREIKEDRSTFFLTRFGAKSRTKNISQLLCEGSFGRVRVCACLLKGENKISHSLLFCRRASSSIRCLTVQYVVYSSSVGSGHPFSRK